MTNVSVIYELRSYNRATNELLFFEILEKSIYLTTFEKQSENPSNIIMQKIAQGHTSTDISIKNMVRMHHIKLGT